jgi:hypothetical protein
LPQEGRNVEDARRNSAAGKFQQENMKLMKDMNGNYPQKNRRHPEQRGLSARRRRISNYSAFPLVPKLHLGTHLPRQLHCRSFPGSAKWNFARNKDCAQTEFGREKPAKAKQPD